MQEQLRLGGKLLDLSIPKIMGILNATPDSFFKHSRVGSNAELSKKVAEMLADGMDILDLGGYSTRPGADFVSTEDEIFRVKNLIKLIKTDFPEINISVDTFRAEVAEVAISEGATMINDISGGIFDPNMFSTVLKHKVAYVLMHCRGTVQTMHTKYDYPDIVLNVIEDLKDRVAFLKQNGQADLIIDPGFGFSKTTQQSFELFANFDQLFMLECPILIGISRKSMIWRTLNIGADQALNGTTALNMLALSKGCAMLRVHDIAAAKEAINLHLALIK